MPQKPAEMGMAVFIAALAIASLFISVTKVRADGIIDLQELSIVYKQFSEGGRDPLITQNGLLDRQLDKELNLNFNVDILKYGYWNNTVHSMIDRSGSGAGGQFRLVGWNFKVGVRVLPTFFVQYEHFSKHLLDYEYPYGGFPVQDSIGFVWQIYKK